MTRSEACAVSSARPLGLRSAEEPVEAKVKEMPSLSISMICSAGVVCLAASTASAVLVDFEGFGNGLEVGRGPHGGSFQPYPAFFDLAVTSFGAPVQGASIFDSTPGGPNAFGSDLDLLVNLGNILIVQNDTFATQTVAGTYDVPNDEPDGGTLFFDFVNPVEMLSVVLIDIDAHGAVNLILTDGSALTRTYSVPNYWTFDISVSGPNGFDTLDLTILTPQLGEGGAVATAVEDLGFNPLDVATLEIIQSGSAGVDNLSFGVIPAPSTLLVLMAGLAGLRRRRR